VIPLDAVHAWHNGSIVEFSIGWRQPTRGPVSMQLAPIRQEGLTQSGGSQSISA